MQCPNCGKEALNINGRQICLDCGIEVAHGVSNAEPQSIEENTVEEKTLSNVPPPPPKEEVVAQENLDNVGKDELEAKGSILPAQETKEKIATMEPTQESSQIEKEDLTEQSTESSISEAPKIEEKDEGLKKSDVFTEEVSKEISASEALPPESASFEKSEESSPIFEDGAEGEKVNLIVAEKKEEAPKVDLTKPRSEDFENVEAKPISELVPKEPPVEAPPTIKQSEAVSTTVNVPTGNTGFGGRHTAETPVSSPITSVDTITSNTYGSTTQTNVQSPYSYPISSPLTGDGMEVMPASVMRSGIVKKIIIISIIVGIIIAIIVLGFIFWDKFIGLISGTGPMGIIE